jgi:signal transduction histidine kinase
MILSMFLICFYSLLLNEASFLADTSFTVRFVITSLLLFILAYPLVLYLIRPLEELKKKAMRFSEGDFSVFEGNVKGNDEIGRLNKYFMSVAHYHVNMIENQKELIAGISHELASPLSRMQVALDIIDSQMKTGEIPHAKTVEKVSGNLQDMIALVKDMLDVSRKDKAFVMNIEKINIMEFVVHIVERFHSSIEKKQIKIKINHEGDIYNVFLDIAKIERAVENLLSNAINYTPSGGEITINLRVKDGYLTFNIKDSGQGIEEKNKYNIFDPFFREDLSRNRNTGGAGLGLAIAGKMINLHRGRIIVENAGIKGAAVTFNIPCSYY